MNLTNATTVRPARRLSGGDYATIAEAIDCAFAEEDRANRRLAAYNRRVTAA